MEVTPGYKQTEVGSIPEDWDVKAISQVAPLQRGFDLPTRNITLGPYPVVYSNGIENFHSTAMVKGPGVVTGRSGTIGKVQYVASDYWPHNTSLWVTRFNGNDPKFIYYLYESLKFERFVSGSGVPTLNRNDAHSYRIALPRSSDEQRAIATALSNVDSLLAGLDRLIAKKRDLKQAAMQQLLTGQTRLPGFSGDWETYTVEELERRRLAKLSRGKVISKKDIESRAGDFPIYSSSIHNDGLFGQYGDFMFEEELITWSVDGGGNFFYRPKHKFSVTNVCGYMRVDTSKICYRYFTAHLQQLHSRKSFDYQSKAHPSVIRKEYQVQLPPLDEQKLISEVLTAMDAELMTLNQRRNKAIALKQGMMQELLTGKTRLV
jgi:type I restriction enzyme S subunit